MNVDIEMIQPGWSVVDANGDEVGTVIAADGPELRVKKGGLLGGEVAVPRESVVEVETGRIEIDRAKGDL